MTARSIRRAIERKRAKQARKAAAVQIVDADTGAASDTPAETSSRTSASRANPALSTGPRTLDGKRRSSLNALKTGLTGRTILMPHDDTEEYAGHIAAYELDYQPVGQHECDLVQSIADIMWRLKRIPALEFALLAKGRLEIRKGLTATATPSEELPLAACGETLPVDLLGPIAELEAYLKYEKQLHNFHLQESRLHRRYTLQVAEFQKLQSERRRREQSELNQAAELLEAAETAGQPFDPVEFGFEFSLQQIKRHLALHPARNAVATLSFNTREGSKRQSQAA